MDNSLASGWQSGQRSFLSSLVFIFIAAPTTGQEFSGGDVANSALTLATSLDQIHYIPSKGLPIPGRIVRQGDDNSGIVTFLYCTGKEIEIERDLLDGTDQTCSSQMTDLYQLEWANVLADTNTITVVGDETVGEFTISIEQNPSDDDATALVNFNGDVAVSDLKTLYQSLPPVDMTVGSDGVYFQAEEGFDWNAWANSVGVQD